MSAMLLILAYLVIGLVLKRTHLMPVNTGQVLNQYVINVAVPAMILLHLPHLDITRAILTPAIMPWVLFPISIALVLTSAKIWKWSRELTGALLIVVPLGNTSFLGFPMIETFFGTAGLPYAVIYDQVGSFIGLAFFATFFAAVYGKREDGNEEKLSIASLTKRLVTFPPVIALIVAFIFGMQNYPGMLQTLISNLAATLVPVVMIAVGFQLQFRIPKSDLLPFSVAMIIKLLILPAVALGLIRALDLNDLAAQVTVLEASMPFMITAGAVAIGAGLKPRFVASLVGYGILFGLITVPIWAWLLQA
ncbi:hypothetical protein CWE08_01765 [Aliidiomarina iranensis]|uniref:Malate permease n=1 Tax=Aliidiomarina iranensis TaxID=1434071 RepID=A0A432W2F4_9GAMM|nr:AEC family transporter [Aliidiomarina iranensis]RUO23401.1 hypothetical protein CWE08_01765 [Aliidiomarina iranensis]